jgi:hypothetical protein
MNANRKNWNEQQQELLAAFKRGDDKTARPLFLRHHAMVHSAGVSGMGLWSFEDEVLDGIDEAVFRRIPAGGEHSIAWNIWHIARIEDVTMNLLVAGSGQVYFDGGWFERLGIPFQDTGNGMTRQDVAALGAEIDLEALRAYRGAVGRRTREIVTTLDETAYRQRVDASRLFQILDTGAVRQSAREVVEYWGKRDIAGLLLMPATRHNFVHLNECLRLKAKRV